MDDVPLAGERLLDTKHAAMLLGVSARTTEDWRWRGGGPVFHKLGQRIVRYRERDLFSFVANGLRENTAGNNVA